jgi:hypothetical protein
MLLHTTKHCGFWKINRSAVKLGQKTSEVSAFLIPVFYRYVIKSDSRVRLAEAIWLTVDFHVRVILASQTHDYEYDLVPNQTQKS